MCRNRGLRCKKKKLSMFSPHIRGMNRQAGVAEGRDKTVEMMMSTPSGSIGGITSDDSNVFKLGR